MFLLLSQDMKTKLLLGCFLFTHILLGQVSDTLSGTVVDGSGAAVAGATVLIRNASGAAQKPARTDANGAFTISGLAAGTYRLVVSNPGFETKELPVTVGAETPAPLHISLAVSGVSSAVLVTATRSEEQADKQQASTSVITIQDLRDRNVQTLDESLDMVPGLYAERDKGPADTMPSTVLRGFTGANRTLVLLDGQPINDPFYGGVTWTSLPIDEMQSVEVVRGPFSSLYVGNALGGVINVRTRPVSHRELDLYSEYGSYETTRNSIRFADRFWDKLGISLGYQRLQFGGYNTVPVTSYASEGTGPIVTGAIPTVDTSGNPVFLIGDGGRNWAHSNSVYVKGDYAFSDATTLNVQYIYQDYAYGYKMYHSYLRDASGDPVDNGTFLASYDGVLQPISVLPSTFLQDDGNQHSHFALCTNSPATNSSVWTAVTTTFRTRTTGRRTIFPPTAAAPEPTRTTSNGASTAMFNTISACIDRRSRWERKRVRIWPPIPSTHSPTGDRRTPWMGRTPPLSGTAIT
jgi:hypothetical protein